MVADVVMSMKTSKAVAGFPADELTEDGQTAKERRGLLGASSRRGRQLAAQQVQQLYHTRADGEETMVCRTTIC
jgi:hypothetical protein